MAIVLRAITLQKKLIESQENKNLLSLLKKLNIKN